MSGYTRFDVANQIANGNVVDAVALDGEFDKLQTAFAGVGGHTHDGGVGEGAPILVVGPAQDVVVSANSVTPKTDNAVDLGSAALEFKNLFIDGVANIDSLVADTADINAGTIDATVIGATTPAAVTGTTITATSFVGPLTGAVVGAVTGAVTGNASTATTLQTPRNIALAGDVTGTVSFNGSANVSITSTVVDNSHNHTLSTITDAGTIASQSAASVAITGGTITGITDLTIADGGTGASTAAGAITNLGITATAAEVNKLAGATATTAQLNFVTGVTSSIQTQINTKANIASPTFTGVPAAPTAAALTNTTQLATTAFVTAGIAAIPAVSSLTQVQAEDPASTVFGTVSGQRLAQAIDTRSPAFGLGQTSQDLVASRSWATTYQNTSGSAIWVSATASAAADKYGYIKPTAASIVNAANLVALTTGFGHVSLYVPNGWYYHLTRSAGANSAWVEVRA